jgi:hypothetical protein
MRVARARVVLSSELELPTIPKIAASTAGMSRIIERVASTSSQKKSENMYDLELTEYIMISKKKAIMQMIDRMDNGVSALGGMHARRKSSAKSTQSVIAANAVTT